MKNKRLLDIFGEIDDRHIAEAAPVAKKSRNKPIWFRWGTIAACMVLVLSVCFGSFAVVAEAKNIKLLFNSLMTMVCLRKDLLVVRLRKVS